MHQLSISGSLLTRNGHELPDPGLGAALLERASQPSINLLYAVQNSLMMLFRWLGSDTPCFGESAMQAGRCHTRDLSATRIAGTPTSVNSLSKFLSLVPWFY